MAQKNSNLHSARKEKNDEFYTQLVDIEKELKHYKEHFVGKTVFCNCDDPKESNFWKFFSLNFDNYKLKRLIATHFDYEKKSYMLDMYRDDSGVHTKIRDLEQNGDFRSPECIELLKQADIVVTNPPFSLFREYVAQLIEYDKKFLIIGSQNNVTYKEVFPLIKENKMWLGYKCGEMEFVVPDYYEPRAVRYREENGIKYRSMGNICWYTNLDTVKRHEELIMYKFYDECEYPKYDDYDAINVDKVSDIPKDYKGLMGVPITYMDKYNPDQFEIVDLITPKIMGKSKYKRLIVRIKEREIENDN